MASENIRHVPSVQVKSSCSPRSPTSQRRIAIAFDLSEESAYAIKWAVENYIRPGDVIILLHVYSTSILYGADWGSASTPTAIPSPSSRVRMEDEFDNFITTKANQLSQPLIDAKVPFKMHIVKDHDMEERLCLEIERLNLSAVIMGSRGTGALSKRTGEGKLGSVSDYCVQHCVCPVVVVRYNYQEGRPNVRHAAVADDQQNNSSQDQQNK